MKELFFILDATALTFALMGTMSSAFSLEKSVGAADVAGAASLK